MKLIYFDISFSLVREKGQLILILVALSLFSSCTKDSIESLNPCDTVAITYSGVVQPILEVNCYGCHSGSSPRGNVSLDNYDDVKVVALDGRLGGTVNYEPGYSPMPQMRDQLDSCYLYYINTWIEEGAPNN